MKILVTGGNGRLGSALVRELSSTHEVIALHGNNSEGGVFVDITRWDEVRNAITHFAPQLVIHTAAWTDVDSCARDPQRAILVNGLGTHYLAAATGANHIPMIYISSNEVFDGKGNTPYSEYHPTQPANPYGYSKWVGELALMRHNSQFTIVRTAWLFAHGGKNFVQTILNAARAGRELRVTCDEIGNPTYNDDLAQAIVALVERGCPGIYHLTNSGTASRYDFARTILDTVGLTDMPIQRISLKEWNRPSNPPPYAPLANQAAATLGISLRSWQEAVSDFLVKEQQKHG